MPTGRSQLAALEREHSGLSARGIAHWTRLVLLGLAFAGADQYLATFSTLLHYAFDGVLFVATVSGLALAPRLGTAWRPVVAYVAVVLIYFGWGIVVSPVPSSVAGRGFADILIPNCLLLLAVCVTLNERSGLPQLVAVLQLAVIANLLVSLFELSHPQFVLTLAYRLDPFAAAVDPSRPAGLWSNANGAGVAMLFAFVIGSWTWRALRLLGRAAALIGIFLTGSREAQYPVVLCLVVFGIYRALAPHIENRSKLAGRWGAALQVAIVGLVATPVVVATQAQGSNVVSNSIVRFLDFGQQLRTPTDVSRSALASTYLDRYLQGPWQGSGLYAFQGSGLSLGAHNMFVMLLGEAGPLAVLLYTAILVYALTRQVISRMLPHDRLVHCLAWLVFVLSAYVSHNFFDFEVAIVYLGLILCSTDVLRRSDDSDSR